MINSDDIFKIAADDILSESVAVDDRRNVPNAFDNDADKHYTLFFCFTSDIHQKDLSDDPWNHKFLSQNSILKLSSFWNRMMNSGLIEEYSEIYECWSLTPMPTENTLYYRVLNSDDEWTFKAYDEYHNDRAIKDNNEYREWELRTAVKIRQFDSRLLWAVAHIMRETILKEFDKKQIRTFYVNDMQGIPVTHFATIVTYELVRKFFAEDSWERVTCDGEDELKHEPVLFRTLQTFCLSHAMIKREIKKCDYLELTKDEYLRDMHITGCGFEADAFRNVEKRIGQTFCKRIHNDELYEMLNHMRITDNELWDTSRKMMEFQFNDAGRPFVFYLKQNLSVQHLQGKQFNREFGQHSLVGHYIKKYDLQDVSDSYVMEATDGTLCVCMWHGLSDMPVTQYFIGVVFKRAYIERACDALGFIYNGFDSVIFKNALK